MSDLADNSTARPGWPRGRPDVPQSTCASRVSVQVGYRLLA